MTEGARAGGVVVHKVEGVRDRGAGERGKMQSTVARGNDGEETEHRAVLGFGATVAASTPARWGSGGQR